MGWRSKILGFLGFLFSVGTHQNEFVKDDPGDRTDGSGFNDNEVNLAVGLSLSEQHQLTAQETDMLSGTGPKPVNEEDIELAVAISLSEQDQLVTEKTETQRETGSFNIKFPPCHLVGYGTQSTENRVEEYEILDVNSPPCTCAGCDSRIEHGICVRRSTFVWHPECFRCHSCKKAMTDDFKFSKSKKRLYHKSCYKVRRPPCFVCKDPLPPNPAGRFPHCEHHFWGGKYCPSHEVDGTAVCCGCERMEQKDIEYLKLYDGRKQCRECSESRTMDTIDSQSLYFDVREFFEDLNMRIEPEIPLYLVERQALNHGYRDAVETRGVCLSEVQTVVNGPRRGDKAGKEIMRVVRKHEVTAILILYGLPRLLTGSILAHELMHAWFKLNGFKNLKPYVEEGICQVLAHMWLVSKTFSGDDTASSSSAVVSKKDKQSDFEKKLVELFKRQIEINPSPDYGDGFRRAIQSVTSYGLAQTLTYIKVNNEFH